MTFRWLHVCILAASLIPNFSFAAETGCAASLRFFAEGKWENGVVAVATYSFVQEDTILEAKYIWEGNYGLKSVKAQPIDLDEDELNSMKQYCKDIFSENQFCSEVESVKAIGDDHEDAPAIMTLFDKNGTKLRRLAVLGNAIGECQDLYSDKVPQTKLHKK